MMKYLAIIYDELYCHIPKLEVLGHIQMDAEALQGTLISVNHVHLHCSQVRLSALVKQLPNLRDLTISGSVFECIQVGHSNTINFDLLCTNS